MKKLIIIITLVAFTCGCNSQGLQQETKQVTQSKDCQLAMKINNEAVKKYANNFCRDSIETAIPRLRKAVKTDPTNLRAYNNLAQCLTMTGRLDEAIIIMDGAIAADTTNYMTYLVKGMLMMKQKKTEKEGKQYVRKALIKNRAIPEQMDSCGSARLTYQALMLDILGNKESAHTLLKNNRERFSKLVNNDSIKMAAYDMDTRYSESIDSEREIHNLWKLSDEKNKHDN